MALEKITRRGFDSPDLIAAEESVITSTLADPDKYIDAYKQDDRSFNGRFVCSDLFKERYEVYADSKESRNRFNGAVHNSAAVLAAEQFRRTLADNSTPEQDTAIFLTGIPGAGKTTTILSNGELPAHIRVVYEGQLSNPQTTVEKVKQALDAGLNVEIVVVHPKPENALNNTFKRYSQEGRGASIEVMATIQGGLPESLELVHDRFGDAVSLTVVDRRDPNYSVQLSGWEHLPVLSSEGNYYEIKNRLNAALEQHREQGIIDEGAYRQAKGGIVQGKNAELGGATRSQLEPDATRQNVSGTNSQENFLIGLRSTTGVDELVETAQEAEREQQALLETAPVEQSFQDALIVYVEEKHEQVDRIEDKLEGLIERQQSRLMQTQSTKPGLFALSGTRRAWREQQIQQQARLQTMQARLETVREIRDGMGLHSPKIEELAERKLRMHEPEIANELDSVLEAGRRHQAVTRQLQNEKKRNQSENLSGGLLLSISQPK